MPQQHSPTWCVSAWGLNVIGMGVPSSQFNEINGLKGSHDADGGSFFDQYSHTTAEIVWRYACLFDPYNDGLDVPEELQQVGREHFARAQGDENWVHVNDLPAAARDIILQRAGRGQGDDIERQVRDAIRRDLP